MSLSPTLFRQGSMMYCVGFTPLICSARSRGCFHFETFQSQHPQLCRDCDLHLPNLRSGFHPWVWDPGIFGFDVRDREVEWMKEVRCFVGIHGRVQVYFGVPRIKDMRNMDDNTKNHEPWPCFMFSRGRQDYATASRF